MKLRYKILLVLTVLGTTFGLGRCKGSTSGGPKLTVPAVLPVNDTEQIRVDPSKHTITILTKGKSTTEDLPDRTSTVDIHKDGSVSVTAPQSGFEHSLFAGVAQSNYTRVMVGADLFYLKRLDVGVYLADRIGLYTPVVGVTVSYNIWSNVKVGLTYDDTQHFGLGLSVRL